MPSQVRSFIRSTPLKEKSLQFALANYNDFKRIFSFCPLRRAGSVPFGREHLPAFPPVFQRRFSFGFLKHGGELAGAVIANPPGDFRHAGLRLLPQE